MAERYFNFFEAFIYREGELWQVFMLHLLLLESEVAASLWQRQCLGLILHTRLVPGGPPAKTTSD